MATEAVYKYLRDQNRPYSANDIVQNMHKEYGKTAVQKALDELAENGRIKEKVYGKQKVYCVMQNEDSAPEEMEKEMVELDEKINELQEELTSNEDKIKITESEVKNLLSSLTTEQAKEEKVCLKEEMEKLAKKLKDLRENSIVISPETKKKIEKEHEKNMREYRKRKRICMDILNSILENYPKKKKDLLEEIGIETDEDAGCNFSK